VTRNQPSIGLCVMSLTAAITVAGAYGGPTQVQARSAEFGISGDAKAVNLLRRARATLGPEDRLRAIKALAVEGTRSRGAGQINQEKFNYLVVFPDKFRSDNDIVATVVNGDHFWRTFHRPVPQWNPSPSENDDVRRRTVLGFVETCLTFLLRAPEYAPVEATFLGSRTYGDTTGDSVQFAVSNHAGELVYVFDPTTHNPLAMAMTGRLAAGSESRGVVRVVRFVNYQTVSGIRVPNVSRESIGTNEASIETSVRIDPPWPAVNFQQPVTK
jgi:hypothetical protein